MIPAAEVQRLARQWKVDPMTVELDYVRSGFLSRWFRHPLVAEMLFKGGTCLRKSYFPHDRFSEDIDLTALSLVGSGQIREVIDAVASELAELIGLDLRAQQPRIVTADAGEAVSYLEEVVYFRCPLLRSGWPGHKD